MRHELLVEGDGRLDPFDDVLIEGTLHLGDGLLPGLRDHDELGDHAVVMGGDAVPGIDVGVDPDAVPARSVVIRHRSGARCEVAVGVLGVDAALDGVHLGVIVPSGNRIAVGEFDLLLDQVVIHHLLGDGVLDLNPGVHLHEVEVPVSIDEEFHGAHALILHGFTGGDGGLAHLLSEVVGHEGRRGLLDEFLVATLDGAVALGEVATLAILVPGDLDLDVAGLRHELLHVHAVVAEGGPGLAAGGVPGIGGVLIVVANPHAASATTGSSLEHHGVADFLGASERLVEAVEDAFAAWNGGHACCRHGGLGGRLVAHGLDHLGGSSDEFDVIFTANLGELGILGEEAVSGMDGIRIGDFRSGDDIGDVEVALGTLGRADADGLIRKADVKAFRIRGGVHGHRLDAHLLARADDPQGDFATVGDQDFLEHVVNRWVGRITPVPRGREAGRTLPDCCHPRGSSRCAPKLHSRSR